MPEAHDNDISDDVVFERMLDHVQKNCTDQNALYVIDELRGKLCEAMLQFKIYKGISDDRFTRGQQAARRIATLEAENAQLNETIREMADGKDCV